MKSAANLPNSWSIMMRTHEVMKITPPAKNQNESLEQLLWEVLWRPLGFERDVQDEFKLDSEEIRLVASVDDRLVGAMVVNTTDEYEYEIRHIAVKEQYQRTGIGKALVQHFIEKMSTERLTKIRTIARNTSQPFFKQLGFRTIQDYPDHPKFIEHGITFSLMEKAIAGE